LPESSARTVSRQRRNEESVSAFGYAAALARWYGSRLTALHVVVTRPAVNIVPSPYPTAFAPVALDGIRAEVMSHLDEVIGQVDVREVAVEKAVEEAPDVSAEILARAGVLPAVLRTCGVIFPAPRGLFRGGQRGFAQVTL
jgi:nucleotide-binding universal stress UspA family protein